MEKLPELNFVDLALMGGLVAIAAGCLLWFRMNSIGQLFLAAARATLQVLMLGIFFTLVLRGSQPIASCIGSLMLLLVVAIATSSRIVRSWQQLLPLILGAFLLSTLFVLGYIYLLVGNGQLPIAYLPILVGVLMAATPPVAISVGQRFLTSLQQEQQSIETRLSLGASSQQWLQVYQRQALSQGLQPALQSLALTGLVTLPSLMAGAMFTGLTPLMAAGYQIVLLLAITVHQILTAALIIIGLGKCCCDQAGRSRSIND